MFGAMESKKSSISSKILGFGLGGFFLVGAALLGGIYLGQEEIVTFKGAENLVSIPLNSSNANSDLPSDLNYDGVEEIYDSLRRNFDGELNEEDLINGIKRGLTSATGDPFTEFFNVSDAEAFTASLDGTFVGIGAELSQDDNQNIIVVSPLEGFPAEAAGLRPQDIIAQIDGEDTAGFTVTQAVQAIRGEIGIDVTLTVVRGNSEVLDITITRDTIDIPSVTSSIENGIGILDIAQFSDDTYDLANAAAQEFRDQDVSGVIVDVRGNPGGFLEQATRISGLWLDDDKVAVDIRSDGESQQTLNANGSRRLQGLPTVVLINGGSASASEIVAGALSDNGVATLVGTQSFGKGSVQNLNELSDGELLKVTTARWFTPNGINIDDEGISPDEVVEISEEQFLADEDPQLDRALEILRGDQAQN